MKQNKQTRQTYVIIIFVFALFTAVLLLAVSAISLHAASIHGVVTDATGARVTGASVALISNGQVVASAASVADGSFTITTGASGRFFLIISATNFRQLQTPDFYAGQFDGKANKTGAERTEG